jgi:uncharacterized phosphosugar-binding protein
MIKKYLAAVRELLERIAEEEAEPIGRAAELVAQAVQAGGVLHVVGAGHSAMVGEELFYRAGGLAAISPLLDSDITVSRGAERSTALERVEGYARALLSHAGIQPEDAVLVVSTSGVNTFPVEAALYAREVGASTIGITSVTYSTGLPPRNPYGKRLLEVVKVVIDNKAPPGDAVIPLEGQGAAVAPVSTLTGCFIANAVVALAAERLAGGGTTPPIWLSSHLPGADRHNAELLTRYRPRIRLL